MIDPFRWVRLRSDLGFVYYKGYALRMADGGIEDTEVVSVYPNDHYRKKFKVKILDRVPFHRRSVKAAKKDAEAIYAATG